MNFTHAIMFHHFHDEKHLPAQGSLSAYDFSSMLDWLGDRHNLLGAKEYMDRFERGSLKGGDVCLSFDDALLCQYDVAIPILDQYNIDAFFFVYSSVFSGTPDNLEIFRYFRTNQFSNIDEFYEQFFNLAKKNIGAKYDEHHTTYQTLDYLSAFPFYSENDKWFRYLRDQVLGPFQYEQLMFEMMDQKDFSVESIISELWMSEDQLKDIAERGHVIGLHSFSHPTQMSKLSFEDQYSEYKKNFDHLANVVGNVSAMSHPCGDYNDETLKILDELGIKIGFRSNLSETRIRSKFEIPREDHANVFKAMSK